MKVNNFAVSAESEYRRTNSKSLVSIIHQVVKKPLDTFCKIPAYTTAIMGGKSMIIFSFRDHNACLRTKKAIIHLMERSVTKNIPGGVDRTTRRVSRTYTPNAPLIETEETTAPQVNQLKRTVSLRGRIQQNKDACAWFEMVMSESEEDSLAVVLKHSEFTYYKAGSIIVDFGDEVRRIYSIFSGHVACKGVNNKVYTRSSRFESSLD